MVEGREKLYCANMEEHCYWRVLVDLVLCEQSTFFFFCELEKQEDSSKIVHLTSKLSWIQNSGIDENLHL